MVKVRMGKIDKYAIIKIILYTLVALLCFYVSFAFGDSGSGKGPADISGLVKNVQGTFKTFARFITGVAFLAGLGFALGSVMKFKAHKDNPTQVPIGMPITLLFIAVALLFLPFLFGRVGMTVFGSSKGTTVSGWSGIG